MFMAVGIACPNASGCVLAQMKVKIKGKKVDVLDADCRTRSCLTLGQDKGTFVPGRGYTKYHEKPEWVCLRRMLHGCPSAGACPNCHQAFVEGMIKCRQCNTVLAKV